MHRTLLLILGSLSIAFAGAGDNTGTDGDRTLPEGGGFAEVAPRVERFLLHPRGKRWESDRPAIGTAKMVGRIHEGGVLLEMELALTEIATRIQRTYRHEEGALGTFVFREWRQSGVASQAGRSLVLEKLPDGSRAGTALLREWAGGDVRRDTIQIPKGALSMLQLVERERGRKANAPSAAWQPVFDDLEGTWEPALILRTPLALGLVPGVRLIDVFPSSGARHSRWLFQGEELLSFLDGNLEACRDFGPSVPAVASAGPGSL